MTQGIIAAFVDGLMRVKRAPWLVIGVWASTLLIATPLALLLQEQIATHLGSSLSAEAAVAGVNYDWWNEFLAQTSGVGLTFVPAIIGFAAVMKNLSTVADAAPLPAVILIAGCSIAWPAIGRSARARSSRRAESTSGGSSASGSSRRPSTGRCLVRITRGCSTISIRR
jgi:hypothetical protein